MAPAASPRGATMACRALLVLASLLMPLLAATVPAAAYHACYDAQPQGTRLGAGTLSTTDRQAHHIVAATLPVNVFAVVAGTRPESLPGFSLEADVDLLVLDGKRRRAVPEHQPPAAPGRLRDARGQLLRGHPVRQLADGRRGLDQRLCGGCTVAPVARPPGLNIERLEDQAPDCRWTFGGPSP